MAESVNLRAVVLDILMEINENNEYSHVVINGALSKFQYLNKTERSFIMRLSQGTVEKMIYLDYVIDLFSKVKSAKMKPLIRNLMRLSVYQILFMDGVPDSAACNEAVKIANKRGFATLKGFVNGVLRNISRNKAEIKLPQELHVRYSIPKWITDKWEKIYGRDTLIKILEAFDGESATYVRCNTLKKSQEEIVEMLKSQGITVEPVEGISGALKISDYDYIAGIEAFEQGLINVQDISSMLVGIVANPKAGDYVIDTCAAPGGKSIHMALLMENKGMVSARDISERKVMMMNDTIARIGLDNVKANVYDALTLNEDDIEKADVVLCDLPCSGLGIIGRKADIKYKMTPEKQAELVKIQREMLKVASKYVKHGGRLVFSTCTINNEENEDNYNWIVNELGFKPEALDKVIPARFLVSENDKMSAAKGYLQLLPGIDGTDGFFLSGFVKE